MEGVDHREHRGKKKWIAEWVLRIGMLWAFDRLRKRLTRDFCAKSFLELDFLGHSPLGFRMGT